MSMVRPSVTRNVNIYQDIIWRGRTERLRFTKPQFIHRKWFEYFVIFMFGSVAYMLIEMAYRGRTHWTMGIVGGLSLLIIGFLNEGLIPVTWGIIPQGIISSVIITMMEFVTGCICNIGLGWAIWDYSEMPLNILGQICLPFSLIWIVLGIVAIFIDDLIRHAIFGEEWPHYDIWMCKHDL